MMQETEEILGFLKKNGSLKNKEAMARYGIEVNNAFGVSVPFMRQLAKDKRYKNNHSLVLELWASEYHEARMIAGFIADVDKITPEIMEQWVADFDSWDICDQICSNVFVKTPFAYNKIFEWVEREETYVRRAAFVLMACFALKKNKLDLQKYDAFWDSIIRYASDERNFVKKSVNWALRQLGKSNTLLHAQALVTIEILLNIESKSAHWIAKDALRELKSESVLKKLGINCNFEKQKLGIWKQ